jgi:carbonic anhydrase/acetyltransferase-like protein (isoleucine patch superfamily)
MPSSSMYRAPQMPDAIHLRLPDSEPSIDGSVFRAPGSVVVGDVHIGPDSSVWYNVVIRADVAPVRIGSRTNIQDGSILHADPGFPCVIGDDVTVGHRAIVHGAKVGNGALIGMGAVLLNGVQVGDEAIVAAGAVVTEGTIIAPGTLYAGIPAKEKRQLDDAARKMGRSGADGYVRNAQRHKSATQVEE